MVVILIWVLLFFRLYSNCTASHPGDFSSYDSRLFASSILPWCRLSLLGTHCPSALGRGILLFTPMLLPEIISWGDRIPVRACCRIPVRACSCWNHSGFFVFFLVIHGEGSDQLDAFLEQKPHGVSNRKPFADWGLWQAGEAGAGVWSERFDTPGSSPLSLALVSKQYRSLSRSAVLLLPHRLPPKSWELAWTLPGSSQRCVSRGGSVY